MINYRESPELFDELAQITKAIAHPQRLCIIKILIDKGESNVTSMQDCLDEAQSKVSQHLIKLKASGIICGRRQGASIYYSIPNAKTKKVLKSLLEGFFQ